MKKVLITGITGFAGSHLAEFLLAQNEFSLTGTHVSDKHLSNIEAIREQITLTKVDLMDAEATKKLIENTTPDIIFHLAASTSVAESFKNPLGVIVNNTASQLNLLEAVRIAGLTGTKIIITSSAHVYGVVSKKDLPINEEVSFKPDNPYSVSKITQDYLALQYFIAHKLSIIRLRPFNHSGSRLSPAISISRFAKSIAEIEKGLQPPVLKVGNLDAKRDFTDVRDIVRAYAVAVDKCTVGEAYNIGSGTAYRMQVLLDKLLALSTVAITVEEDPAFLRPSDIPELRCDVTKFHAATGWMPEISIEDSLKETLDYWRNIV